MATTSTNHRAVLIRLHREAVEHFTELARAAEPCSIERDELEYMAYEHEEILRTIEHAAAVHR